MTLLKPSNTVVDTSSSWMIRPALKWRQASRNRLPAKVDLASTSSMWEHKSRLNGRQFL
jgi:hypothetical protein